MPGVDRRPVFNPLDLIKSDYFNRMIRWVWKDRAVDDLVELNDQWRLRDEALSVEPGMLRNRLEAFEQELLVSADPNGALSVVFNGGRPALANGDRVQVVPGSLLLADNALNFVFVDDLGVVRASTIKPIRALPLAEVTTLNGTVPLNGVVDVRGRGFEVHPPWELARIFGGNGDQGNKVISGAETWGASGGEFYWSGLTINSTGAVTSIGLQSIDCSGDVVISGSITVSPFVPGGAGKLSFGSIPSGTVFVSFSGQGFGGGQEGTGGGTYPPSMSLLGSGGASSPILIVGTGQADFVTGGGGLGGGGLIIRAAGSITINGSISIKGGVGDSTYATGGTAQVYAGGGGGGSGGGLRLTAYRGIYINETAIIDLRGGNGGNVTLENVTAGIGGGGGGGGSLSMFSRVIVVHPNAQILLDGGLGGASHPTNPFGRVGGGGGSFGGIGGAAVVNPPVKGENGLLISKTLNPIS